jgi:hypothetical protein
MYPVSPQPCWLILTYRLGARALWLAKLPQWEKLPKLWGEPIGRRIRYVAVTDELWANAVKERLGPHALDHPSHLWQRGAGANHGDNPGTEPDTVGHI